MRVAFLEIDAERSWAVASIGPAFLAAYLRAHGHGAVFLRIGLDETPADIRQRVADAAPQLTWAVVDTLARSVHLEMDLRLLVSQRLMRMDRQALLVRSTEPPLELPTNVLRRTSPLLVLNLRILPLWVGS